MHLRDIPVSRLPDELAARGFDGGVRLAHRIGIALHRDGALSWDELAPDIGRPTRNALAEHFEIAPRLAVESVRHASDEHTRKYLFRIAARSDAATERSPASAAAAAGSPPRADNRDDGAGSGGDAIESVMIRHWDDHTLCLSSQAGCAMGCTFCATGRLALRRNLTAGEITEQVVQAQRDAGVRVNDVVFMGMGEPLHNYDAVMTACENLNGPSGHSIGRKRITVSTVGLVREIRRFTRERRPWRLHVSLHAAIQETRERIVPAARTNRLPDLLDAIREHQRELAVKWVTLQYVALPGVNMDQEHIDALGRELQGIRYILNVIPWNETGDAPGVTGTSPAFRAPDWDEVRAFTAKLRALHCPVKVRYSAGKREGMGCGQLAAETLAVAPSGHMLAPPGIFTT